MSGKRVAPRAASDVLPTGKFDGTRQSTISKPNAFPQFTRNIASRSNVSTAFDQVDPNETPARFASKWGDNIHSDPFDAQRERVQRPVPRLIQHPVSDPAHFQHKQARHIPPPVYESDPHTFITANLTVCRGGKHVPAAKHETTLQNEQQAIDYASMARFRSETRRKDHPSPIVNGSLHEYNPEMLADVSREYSKKLGPSHTTKKRFAVASPSLAGVMGNPDTAKRPRTAYVTRPPWGTVDGPFRLGAASPTSQPRAITDKSVSSSAPWAGH